MFSRIRLLNLASIDSSAFRFLLSSSSRCRSNSASSSISPVMLFCSSVCLLPSNRLISLEEFSSLLATHSLSLHHCYPSHSSACFPVKSNF
jgi:hypothetical protein